MRSRINLILLGVADVARASTFYEALGWRKGESSHAEFAKFDLGGVVIALQSRTHFAQDARYNDAAGSGFSGMALAYIAHSPEEVGQVLSMPSNSVAPWSKPPPPRRGAWRAISAI